MVSIIFKAQKRAVKHIMLPSNPLDYNNSDVIAFVFCSTLIGRHILWQHKSRQSMNIPILTAGSGMGTFDYIVIAMTGMMVPEIRSGK